MTGPGKFVLACLTALSIATGLLPGNEFHKSSIARAAERPLPFGATIIADIAEKASPAVVHLELRKKISMNMASLDIPFSQFFFNGRQIPLDVEKFFENTPETGENNQNPGPKNRDDKTKPGAEQRYTVKPEIASGFIIRPDGYILTNAHAVDGQDRIKVTLYDKRSYEAEVVGIDHFSDLAVVKIDAKNLPTLPWGSSSELRPGEFAVAIGSPLGEERSVTFGIISAVGRTEMDVNGNINFIQTDAAINPGNSGGPLLNLHGEVVGVNTAIRKYAQNIAYSIPADIAQSVSEQLISTGNISRPWLGIQMAELDEAYLKGMGLPLDTKGVLIASFVQGSPAQASGLKINDIVQKIDGQDMKSPKDIKDYVLNKKSGQTLNFIVLRSGKVEALPVSVGTYPRAINAGRR